MAQSVLVYPVQDGSLISSLSNDNKNEPTGLFGVQRQNGLTCDAMCRDSLLHQAVMQNTSFPVIFFVQFSSVKEVISKLDLVGLIN